MTYIEYYDNGNEFSLEVQGHAGYDVKGQDIVCAGISTLVQTLIAHMDEVSDRSDNHYRSGYAWVYGSGYEAVEAFRTIMTGLQLVYATYPEYIVIKEGCTLQTEPTLI